LFPSPSGLLLLGWIGCAGPLPQPCDPLSLGAGEVFSGLIECEAQIPWGAEGLVGDLILANHQGYAVIRVDPDARHFIHVGGGGVVDFSAWDEPDAVAEVIPLVESAWIRGGILRFGESSGLAWAEVSGSLAPIPFLSGGSAAEAHIRFELDAEGLALELKGADGQLFLGEPGGVLSSEGLWSFAGVGVDLVPVVSDLGGAVVSGASVLSWAIVAPTEPEVQPPEPEEWKPNGMVRVDLGGRSFPSRDSRLSPKASQALAREKGAALLVLGALDEVGVPDVEANEAIRVVGASEARAPGMGRVLAWPFAPKNHRPAHGAVPWEGLTAVEVLAVAKGDAANRLTMVDVDWLLAAGPVEQWDPLPDFIWVEDLAAFHFLRSIWQEGLPLGTVGEMTWIPVSDPNLPSLAALHRPLIALQSSAGTGPALVVDRFETDDDSLDRVEVALQMESVGDVQRLRFWSANQLLGERELEAGETRSSVQFWVPSHRDIWVSAEGEKWGLSSVQLAGNKALPDLQGDFVRHPNAVFDSNAP
jgi:hypothetical protein